MGRPFRDINITYLALFGIQIITMSGVVLFMQRNPGFGSDDAFPFMMTVPILFVSGIAIAFLIDRNRNRQAPTLNFSGFQKLRHYKTTVLLRCTIIEGVNLFIALAALVTGNWLYILYFSVGLLIFLYFRPAKPAFQRLYNTLV